MKTIGLIGGTSWHATLEYYRDINTRVSKRLGNGNNPELLIHSINIEIMRKQVMKDIEQKYLEVSQHLASCGAKAIVICANTPHMVVEKIQPDIDIPFLHIADATARAAQEQGFKSLGLLGTKATMVKPFLKDKLSKKYNLEIAIPEKAYIDQTHQYISKELTQGKFSREAKDFFCLQIQNFKDRGIDAAILGCTEIPILLKDVDTVLPTLSTTDLHIDMAVDFIMS